MIITSLREEIKMKIVKNLSFQPEDDELLREVAKRLELSQSEVVRQLIKDKATSLGIISNDGERNEAEG